MIPYDELDRALARWKARAQGGVPEAPEHTIEASAAVEMDAGEAAPEDMPTPLPIPAEELGSIPNVAAPYANGSTGEIDVNELEAYEDDPKRN